MEKVLVAANWKMYKTSAQVRDFFGRWPSGAVPAGREAAVFPPFPYLSLVRDLLPEGMALGAQNAHEAEEGAFTGEVSCAMARDAGCAYVLVGHSERRHVFGETDLRLAAKVLAAFRHGLRPVLCVGEKLDEREAGRTLDLVRGQLGAALAGAPTSGFDIAYEPVWAIGTGKTATTAQAQEVHAAIRKLLGEMFGASTAAAVRVQYGGSVKPDNAAELMAQPDVDGALVGGASLKAPDFSQIVKGALR